MNKKEAMTLVGKYFYNGQHDEDEAAAIDALKVLSCGNTFPAAEFTALLGDYYYEKKVFILARKYYERAVKKGSTNAYIGLGDLWFYGKNGVTDYEKAIQCYMRAAEEEDYPDAQVRLADMIDNGYGVEKDHTFYKQLIEELYEEVRDDDPWASPVGEILSRLAVIRKEEGKDEEAMELLLEAEEVLRLRLREIHSTRDLEIMKNLKERHYRWAMFDRKHFRLYDLYYLLKKPVKVCFSCLGVPRTAEAFDEKGEIRVAFEGKWFENVDDFFEMAKIDGEKITALEEEMSGFTVG